MKKQILLVNFTLIFSVMFCTAFACRSDARNNLSQPARNAQDGAPSEEEIKLLIEKRFATNEYPTRKDSVEFHDIEYLPPEQSGEYGLEGMPAGRKTTYYPVKIKYTTIAQYTDGSERRKDWNGVFNFWRGSDGEWAYNATFN